MGCFNFNCVKCGEGCDEEGFKGRDYDDKPCKIIAKTKAGKTIVIEGTYSGYGEVEVLGDEYKFYLRQFEEYWEGWQEDIYSPVETYLVGEEIYCEMCMDEWGAPERTPCTEYSITTDFETVQSYLEKKKAPPPPVAAPPPAAEKKQKKTKKVAAAPKPKPLTKAELLLKVAELEKEVGRLKPMEERLITLDKAHTTLNQQYIKAMDRIARVQKALY